MKKMIFTILLGLFVTMSSGYAEDPIVSESTYFHVEQTKYEFLEADDLAVMDQCVQDFLNHFNMTLDEKISIEIFLVNEQFLELVHTPDSLYEKAFVKEKEMPITDNSPLLKFGILHDQKETAKWIALKFALDFLIEGKVYSEMSYRREFNPDGQVWRVGYYGSIMSFLYPRYALDALEREQDLREGLDVLIDNLSQERGNFLLAVFTEIPEDIDDPTEEEILNDLTFYKEVKLPLTMCLIEFVIDNYGYDKLLEFMINDNIEHVFGVTESEFEDLWYDYFKPADPTP